MLINETTIAVKPHGWNVGLEPLWHPLGQEIESMLESSAD
jgi:ABC-type cobalt transport system substrate-binding protein